MNSHQLIHLRSRVLNRPLLVAGEYLNNSVIPVLWQRLGLSLDDSQVRPAAMSEGEKRRKAYKVTDDDVAVISIVGPLVKRASGSAMSGGPTTYNDIYNEFLDAATDPKIKGILLEIDSPGGEAAGVLELANAILSQRGSKPIYAVADSDAFSAAYWIASAAERVYVSESGGVGSIGVVCMHADQTEKDAKDGIKYTLFTFGKFKADFNPHRELTDAASVRLQSHINDLGEEFVNSVAKNRGITPAAVKGTEADLFFGKKAIKAKLADKIGDIHVAMMDIRSAIKSNERYKGTRMDNEGIAAVSAAESVEIELTNHGPVIGAGQSPEGPQASTAPNPPESDTVGATEASTNCVETAPALPAAAVIPVSNPIPALSGDDVHEIIALCTIFGDRNLSVDFIDKNVSVAAVRKQLFDLRVSSSRSEEIIIPSSNGNMSMTQSAENSEVYKQACLIADRMNSVKEIK